MPGDWHTGRQRGKPQCPGTFLLHSWHGSGATGGRRILLCPPGWPYDRISPGRAAAIGRSEAIKGDTRRMQVISTEIADVKEIRPVRHHDPRGFFSEIFREEVLREHGIDVA